MSRRIDCYFDIASLYSYFAFTELANNLDKLAAYGVEVELHPTLIGGINHLSGNKPPWMLPAKAKYVSVDSQRAAARLSLSGLSMAEEFMSMNHTVSPLRALHYIKDNYPRETFFATIKAMFERFWTAPHVNLTKDDGLAGVLASVKDSSGRKCFTDDHVAKIMAAREHMKNKLKDTTQKAVDLGAFGAPWFWVTNAKGQSQGFFGSDRFNHIYRHLDIPFQDVAILPPSKL